MRCAEPRGARRAALGGAALLTLALVLGGCAQRAPSPTEPSRSAPVPATAGERAPATPGSRVVALPPPATPRNWEAARLQAAQRLVAANPGLTYTGAAPDVLLAIPVLTIELHADGRIRHIEVMRYPGQARDTVELAKEAVRRAAPFGDVSKLPRPWKFNETFLFNGERKFKPMTLDRR